MTAAGGKRNRPDARTSERLTGHFDRRLDKADAARAFVFLLALRLLKVFDALEATRLLVRTEFLGKGFPPFNENMGSLVPFHSILLHESIANLPAAVNDNSQ